ncbi:MAG: menaquinol oxidoreductase [Desulfuromonadaceae bacterium]
MLCDELTAEIKRLQRLSTRGLLALALFLGVSMCAWWNFPLLPVPDTVTALLGRPPSARIISTVLLLYTFSALILSLSRMTAGVEHRSSFSHVGYLTAFFIFYYYGKTLEENYWAVFGAGITILGVESYRIWSFCAEGITKKREDLEFVTRTGRPPPEE